MNGYSKDSGVTTRLPSFQQLMKGFQDSESPNNTTTIITQHLQPQPVQAQRLIQYSPGKLTPTATTFGNYTLNPEYPYHHHQHHYDNSYPQYPYPPGPSSVKSARASPMNRGRSLSFSYPQGTSPIQDILESGIICNEYQFISNLIQFLIEFEKKCHDFKLNYTNNPNDLSLISEKILTDFDDLDDALHNCNRVVKMLENIKILNEKTRVKRSNTSKRIDKRKLKKKSKTGSDGGSDLGLEINVAATANHDQVNIGGLNPELSIKPEITCQHCCSQETPEWRRGPEGSRTLCNACGLFYSKLIKKYGLQEADKVMYQRKQTGTVNDRRIF
ncbi:uncharacterized protein SPAPADRAFT_66267 [Spathaspora passalidarum NRRL Y-27907]|uniref:GATA-type domain-containing protein n=1 Tax=Spathaspora passalidarum (strain NRRL Y-27907 / 11-Y1) TaxID=619300 RepID=G3ALP2_SPAPN|nr:uncharacterized protein SPAPADRAFT_66267 [Spathaspora passalidarum NRRL Y-27907]EGW33285.1 hypothetical protein SPAPADRAFT_66267 [Spathaspora passalidarum NRRL Y-27907]